MQVESEEGDCFCDSCSRGLLMSLQAVAVGIAWLRVLIRSLIP